MTLREESKTNRPTRLKMLHKSLVGATSIVVIRRFRRSKADN